MDTMCKENISTVPKTIYTVHRSPSSAKILSRAIYTHYAHSQSSNGSAEHMKGSIEWNKHTDSGKKREVNDRMEKREDEEKKGEKMERR